MAKKELIAIVFSDLHLHIWSKFNENNKRTLEGFRVLSYLSEKYTNVPALFCGDMFHKSNSMDYDLMKIWRNFRPKEGWECWAISGNHSIYHKNSVQNPQDSWISLLENDWLKCIDFNEIHITNNVRVLGIPYCDNNEGIDEYLKKYLNRSNKSRDNSHRILMLHTTYPGAKDTDGREVESSNNINPNLLNKFDLVLCGHIHKPQKLGKKVYMIGAPIQQRRTDKNCKLGYWELYSDLSMEFIELKDFPKFIDVESEEDIKDDDNYYTIIPPKSSEPVVTKHKITKRLSKKSLVRKYMRAKGIQDDSKKNLLIDILKRTDS